MKFVDILASYLPSMIVRHLKDHDTTELPPSRQTYTTVCMFADVSGFTALSEAMAKYGPEGAEYLAKHLNSYFGQMVKIIASEGGDIFKFAGDAMIILWPDVEDIPARARRAARAAVSVQQTLHAAELSDGVTLSVKIGIGVGPVSVLHLGGELRRMEYVAVGEPLVQAFAAEGHCGAGGDSAISPSVAKLVSAVVDPVETCDDGFWLITKGGKGKNEHSTAPILKRMNKAKMMQQLQLDTLDSIPGLERLLRCYVPGAILPWVSPDCPDLESWGGDLRNVAVMFVNLGLKDHDLLAAAQYDDAMLRAHEVLKNVQAAVYQYEGSVNKFLMDDKGSTLIAVWGLPPLSHEDDATRATLCGLSVCERLWALGLQASCGITTGVVFCGVVGSTTRKEYSVLGDTVNLSARLMQYACKNGGGVVCASDVKVKASAGLEWQSLGDISVKGKSTKISIFHPYTSSLPADWKSRPVGDAANPYKLMHEEQLASFAHSSVLRPHVLDMPAAQAAPAAPGPAAAPSTPASALKRTTGLLGKGIAQPQAVPKPKLVAAHPLQLAALHRPGRGRASRAMTLLSQPPAPFSFSTVLSFDKLQVRVATFASGGNFSLGMLESAPLLDDPVPVTEDTQPRAMRDAAFEAAQAAGLVDSAEAAKDWVLVLTGTRYLLPLWASMTEPLLWLSVYLSEVYSDFHLAEADTLGVTLVKAADCGAVVPEHSRAWQQLILQRVELAGTSQGACTLLDGPAGIGKTFLLRELVQRGVVGQTNVFATAGLPYERHKTHAAWGRLLGEWLDQLGTLSGETSRTAMLKTALDASRMPVELQSVSGLLNDMLGVSLPAGSHISNLGTADQHAALGAIIVHAVRGLCHISPVANTLLVIDDGLYMAGPSWDVVLAMAAHTRLPPSHPLALPVQLAVSTRTMDKYIDVLLPALPRGYTALLESPFVSVARVGRMPVEETAGMVASALNWNGLLGSQLVELVQAKAQGNPLIATEVALSLAAKGRLMVLASDGAAASAAERTVLDIVRPPLGSDASGAAGRRRRRSSVQPGSSTTPVGAGFALDLASGLDTEVPYCYAVSSNLGMQVDRLDVLEQMVLKVGSVICHLTRMEQRKKSADSAARSSGDALQAGMKFKFSVLREAFPLVEHREELTELCSRLEQKGFILRPKAVAAKPVVAKTRRLSSLRSGSSHAVLKATSQGNSAGLESSAKELEFQFVQVFLADTVRLRVLAEQRKVLEKSITDALRVQQDKLKRSMLNKMMTSPDGSIKSAYMEVRKHIPATSKSMFLPKRQEWKRRWVTINNEIIQMYKENPRGDASITPVQIIPVRGASATMVAATDVGGKEHVFRVDSASWVKKGKDMSESRSFYMAADNAAAAEDWVFRVQFYATKSEDGEVPARTGSTTTPATIAEDQESDSEAAAATPAAGKFAAADALAALGFAQFAAPRLVLTVESAVGVARTLRSGEALPYVVAKFRGQVYTTDVPAITTSPKWDATFTLPAMDETTAGAAATWDESAPLWAPEDVLTLQLWNKDKHGTDVLLGCAFVSAADIPRAGPLKVPASLSEKLHKLAQRGEESSDGASAGDADGDGSEYSSDDEDEQLDAAALQLAQLELREQQAVPATAHAMVRACDVVAQRLADRSAESSLLSPAVLSQEAQQAANTFPVMGQLYIRARLVTQGNDIPDGLDEPEDEQEPLAATRLGRKSWSGPLVELAKSHVHSGKGLLDLNDQLLALCCAYPLTGPAVLSVLAKALADAKRQTVDMAALAAAGDVLVARITAAMPGSADSVQGKLLKDILEHLNQSSAALRAMPVAGRAVADAAPQGSSADEFRELMTMANLDEASVAWLASSYSREAAGASSSPAGRRVSGPSMLGSGGAAGPSSSAASSRRASALASRTAQADDSDANSVDSLDEPVQVEPRVLGPEELHMARCAELPGYMLWGGATLSWPCTPGRYGWGIISVQPSEDLQYTESERAGIAAAGHELVTAYWYDPMDDLVYEDMEGNVQGPFAARDIYEWFEDGYMPEDMAIRCGSGEGAPEMSLSDVLPALAIRTAISRMQEFAGEAVGTSGFRERDWSSWDFNIMHHEQHPARLLAIASCTFAGLLLPRVFPIPESAFTTLVTKVQEHMSVTDPPTPYHNLAHALDVLQAVYAMLTQFQAGAILTAEETLAMWIAALCHDLEHPGLNNAYQVNSGSSVALRYNDVSVLENHHAALASELLRDTGLLALLPAATSRHVRSMVLACILSTDMTMHFDNTKALDALASQHRARLSYLLTEERQLQVQEASLNTAQGSSYGIVGKPEEPCKLKCLGTLLSADDRLNLMRNLLHSADISNPARSWQLATVWSDRVMEEFFAQGDREAAEGLPVSLNCNRETTQQAAMSLNFIDFIVAPLFVGLAHVLPKSAVTIRHIMENRKQWSQLNAPSLSEDAKEHWASRERAFNEVVQAFIPSGPSPPPLIRPASTLSMGSLQTFAAAVAASPRQADR